MADCKVELNAADASGCGSGVALVGVVDLRAELLGFLPFGGSGPKSPKLGAGATAGLANGLADSLERDGLRALEPRDAFPRERGGALDEPDSKSVREGGREVLDGALSRTIVGVRVGKGW